MEQLIPAQEAHIRANAVREAHTTQELEEVISKINKAWDEGLYKVEIDHELSSDVVLYLASKGYDVSYDVSYYAGSQLDSGTTTIRF